MIELKESPPEKSQLKIEKSFFKAITLFSVVMIMIYLNMKEFLIFLAIVEVTNIVLAISISVVVLSTYGLSKGREFPLLGIAYIFISIFLFLHAITLIFQYRVNTISTVIIIIALYMESITFVFKGILLKQKINIYLYSIIYMLFSAFLLFDIFKWNFFINSIISNKGMYFFTKVSLYIIAAVFAISIGILHYKRKYVDTKLFQYFIAALLFKILSTFMLSFILVDESNKLMDLIGYSAAMVSYYYLYLGIIVANLKKPYDEINTQNHILRAILESTTDGILVVDEIGKVLHYNKKFVRMWKIPKGILEKEEDKEFVNFVRNQLVDPDNFFMELKKEAEISNDDISIIPFKDGRVYEYFSRPLLVNHKTSGSVRGFRDITGQMNMIEDLKLREKTIATSLNAISYANMEGKVTYANQSFLDLYGYSGLEEIKNKQGIEFSSEPNLKVKIANGLINNGKWSGEVRGKRKDQSTFYAECFCHFIYDKDKEPIYIVTFLNDISSRKEIEKEHHKSQALYRQFIEILPNAVFVCKGEKIILTNKEGLKLAQYSSDEEIINKQYHEVIGIHSDYAEVVAERVHKIMTEETAVDFLEQKIILRDGSIVDVEAASVCFKQDEEHYLVTVIQDLSERKKMERLQQQTQLFSNISHELKTPLNIILGAIQLLHGLHDASPESVYHKKNNKYLWIMKQNCYRLLRLMNNLIDLTKVDNGFLKLKLGNYNIVGVVENITQSVVEYGAIKDIDIRFDTDVEEKILFIDPDKIERILLNLLSNAIKFTENGGSITVTVQEYEDAIGISVKDTGIGIPEEQATEVFERFMQVSSLLHRKNEGSGIGLSLVKALVEAHNGKISVKSKLGEGSEFIIKLPTRYYDEAISQHDEIVEISTREVNTEKICTEFSDIYRERI